jgi:hypothetical protein
MRPVLMTSATVILALFPAALGLGAGAETNQPLSIAVIGGMISSTLLTLVVVPAVYSLVEGGWCRAPAAPPAWWSDGPWYKTFSAGRSAPASWPMSA